MTAASLAGVSEPVPRLALQARLTANEMAKGLRLTWRRRALVITSMAFFAVVYLGLSLLVGGGHLVKPVLTLTIPAMCAVAVASTAALQGSGGVAEEINGGTLEQAQLSQAPPALQALGRLGALAAEGLVPAAVLGVAFSLVVGLRFHPSPAAAVPAVLTMLDALGYGLVIAALTVRVASIGAVTHVLNMAIQFFGGMMVPVTVFPPGLEIFARFIPTTLGVEALNTTLAGRPLSATWADGTLPWLMVHVAVSLGIGFTLYSANIRRARREGGLSPR
jgi:ABC-2 type transport system permease protein